MSNNQRQPFNRGRDFAPNDADRNRSRSRDQSLSYQQGGQRGYQQRDRHNPPDRAVVPYGGRGGGGRNSSNRPEFDMVKLNYFRLNLTLKAFENCTWVHYTVKIFPGKSTWDNTVSPKKQTISTIDSRAKEGTKKELNFDGGSTPLSKRILQYLRQEIFNTHGIAFAVDGTQSGYAPKRIFHESGADPRISLAAVVASSSTAFSGPGVYGPADCGTSLGGQQGPQEGLTWYFCIKAEVTCDETAAGAESTKKQWFIVRIREVGPVYDTSIPAIEDDLTKVQQIKQCLDTIFKCKMYSSGMTTEGKSPRLFYLPEENQRDRRVLGDFLAREYLSTGKEPSFAPYVGLCQTIRICAGGNMFSNLDVGLSWMNINFKDRLQAHPRKAVMLLDREKKSLAGVFVGSLDKPIKDPKIAEAVKSALKGCTFNVRYEQPWSRADEEEFRSVLLAEGKDQESIEKKVENKKKRKKRILNNLTVRWNSRDHPGIIMTANDPELHSFEFKPRKPSEDDGPDPPPIIYDVARYFRERKGITLAFPYMPMVYTQDGYFPVEFLQQAFGKMKNANSSEQVKQVLGFNDEFASTKKIDQIAFFNNIVEKRHEQSGLSASALLSQFSIQVNEAPVTLKAKVLREPVISFRSGQSASLRDGSWNLLDGRNDQVFQCPAKMNSFAFIDFAGNERTSNEFIRVLASRMKAHGMELPRNINIREAMSMLTVNVGSNPSPAEVYASFKEAIEKSKKFFLCDSSGCFQGNKSFFRTNAVATGGQLSECIIFPWTGGGGDNGPFDIILPFLPTHIVRDKDDNEIEARIHARVMHRDTLVDLFDITWDEGVQCKAEGECTRFIEYVWRAEDGRQFTMHDVDRAIHSVMEWQVECPSVIFCQLPDDGAGRYNLIKLMSNFVFGVQSQCFLRAKFDTQKNPDQYCSNIALKLNAKLSSKITCAYAWNVGSVETKCPWLQEVPTMVMGISTSRGIGESSQTIVAASACLKSGLQIAQAFRVQKSPDLIEHDTLVSLTKNLAIQYFLHTEHKLPNRIVIYRNGSSEEKFDLLMSKEVASIRKAFAQLRYDHDMDDCTNPECQGSGCTFCTPIITYIVALSQHNIRVVPETYIPHGKSGGPRNVLSGTCVDHTINAFWDSKGLAIKLPSEAEHAILKQAGCELTLFEIESTFTQGFDFLLTAHGGLKGTSKPICYRVVLNENLVWKNASNVTPLTKDNLQVMTYHMSYQYATATKCVRMVPVVYYSQRLANIASGYIGYLTGERNVGIGSQLNSYLDRRQSEDDANEFSYFRHDMELLGLDETIKSELLPSFSPYELKLEKSIPHPWRPPFFTHMSA